MLPGISWQKAKVLTSKQNAPKTTFMSPYFHTYPSEGGRAIGCCKRCQKGNQKGHRHPRVLLSKGPARWCRQASRRSCGSAKYPPRSTPDKRCIGVRKAPSSKRIERRSSPCGWVRGYGVLHLLQAPRTCRGCSLFNHDPCSHFKQETTLQAVHESLFPVHCLTTIDYDHGVPFT